ELQLPHHFGPSVSDLRARVASISSYALFATVGGRVVLRHGSVEIAVEMQSVQKALMNALVGRAVDEGHLSLAATMGDLGIDDLEPALTAEEKRATVLDCLMARSGIYHKAAYEPLGLDGRRPERGSHAPGEHWFYNNWDFNVLTTILQSAMGIDSFQAFDEWFAQPMGMQDFDPGACRHLFEACSRHPAYLFSASARDLARFGHLYLCRGDWAGTGLLSEEWVDQSVYPHSKTTHEYAAHANAFGLMWWVMRPELCGGLR